MEGREEGGRKINDRRGSMEEDNEGGRDSGN